MSYYPAVKIGGKWEDLQAYFNIVKMCLARNNPVLNLFKRVQYIFYIVCTINQKLNIVKQRVNHMKFRLHQMEQLIAQNNSYTFTKGQSINQIR